MKKVSRTRIRRQAEQVFGSKADARDWFDQPAIALEQRRPIDLIGTPEGRQVLENLLTQLEYGVYI